MLSFIKKYYRSIILIGSIVLIIAGVFLYKYIIQHSGTYAPNNGPFEYEIKQLADNQYEVVYMNDVDVYKGYHKEFVRLLLNNPIQAYDKLTDECKTNIFNNSYDNFVKYIKKLDKTVLLTSYVEKYSKENDRIIVIDNTQSSYIFYEQGVWNYKVYLTGYIR